MKYKIAVVVSWFGDLPPTYRLWRKSVLYNETVDFFLYTDALVCSEKNLHVQRIAFEDYVRNFQRIFHFPISCSKPYKLCDFRPAIGEAWKEFLSGYDFWGYCDMDIVYGNIRKFITDEILEEYERIFLNGHFSLFRNEERLNLLFRETGIYPEYNIEEAYTTDRSCYFDEFRGMELKCIRKGIRVFNRHSLYSDYDPRQNKFYRKGKQVINVWENGTLYSVSPEKEKEELVYVHICRRKMTAEETEEGSRFAVLPGKIISFDGEVQEEMFRASSGKSRLAYKYMWSLDRLKKQLKANPVSEIVRERIRMHKCAGYKKKLLERRKNCP